MEALFEEHVRTFKSTPAAVDTAAIADAVAQRMMPAMKTMFADMIQAAFAPLHAAIASTQHLPQSAATELSVADANVASQSHTSNDASSATFPAMSGTVLQHSAIPPLIAPIGLYQHSGAHWKLANVVQGSSGHQSKSAEGLASQAASSGFEAASTGRHESHQPLNATKLVSGHSEGKRVLCVHGLRI